MSSTNLATQMSSEGAEWSPAAVLEKIPVLQGTVTVLRDDLLVGGTKQRAIVPYLLALKEQGYCEFVYASPFCGFAQVALATAAKSLNLKVRLFCETEKNINASSPLSAHAYTKIAIAHGAEVDLFQNLNEAEGAASQYQEPDSFKIPLGFQDPIFLDNMAKEVSKILKYNCNLKCLLEKASSIIDIAITRAVIEFQNSAHL